MVVRAVPMPQPRLEAIGRRRGGSRGQTSGRAGGDWDGGQGMVSGRIPTVTRIPRRTGKVTGSVSHGRRNSRAWKSDGSGTRSRKRQLGAFPTVATVRKAAECHGSGRKCCGGTTDAEAGSAGTPDSRGKGKSGRDQAGVGIDGKISHEWNPCPTAAAL